MYSLLHKYILQSTHIQKHVFYEWFKGFSKCNSDCTRFWMYVPYLVHIPGYDMTPLYSLVWFLNWRMHGCNNRNERSRALRLAISGYKAIWHRSPCLKTALFLAVNDRRFAKSQASPRKSETKQATYQKTSVTRRRTTKHQAATRDQSGLMQSWKNELARRQLSSAWPIFMPTGSICLWLIN
jgi:hypothetical protein